MSLQVSDLKIGMKIDLRQRRYDWREWGRIEALGFDWAVCRADNNQVFLLDTTDNIYEYKEESESN